MLVDTLPSQMHGVFTVGYANLVDFTACRLHGRQVQLPPTLPASSSPVLAPYGVQAAFEERKKVALYSDSELISVLPPAEQTFSQCLPTFSRTNTALHNLKLTPVNLALGLAWCCWLDHHGLSVCRLTAVTGLTG